jgi:hypothetical protein
VVGTRHINDRPAVARLMAAGFSRALQPGITRYGVAGVSSRGGSDRCRGNHHLTAITT